MNIFRILLLGAPYFFLSASGLTKPIGVAVSLLMMMVLPLISRLRASRNPYAGSSFAEQLAGGLFLLVSSLTLFDRHGLSFYFPVFAFVQLVFLAAVRFARSSDERPVKLFLPTDGLTSFFSGALLLSASLEGLWDSSSAFGLLLILALAISTLIGAATALIYGVFRLSGAFRYQNRDKQTKKPLIKPVPITVFLTLAALALLTCDFFLFKDKTPEFDAATWAAVTGKSQPSANPPPVVSLSSNWAQEQLSSSPLVLGPAVGKVSDTSVRIWVASQTELNLTAVVLKEGVEVTRVPLSTQAARDLSGYAEVIGLQPETTYTYQILDANGSSVVPAELVPYCRFHTFPPVGQPNVKLRYAITSCHRPLAESADYYSGAVLPERFMMWETLSKQNQSAPFDFVLMLGDQAYNDIPFAKSLPNSDEWALIQKDANRKSTRAIEARKMFRDNYIKFWSHPAYRKVMASIPAFMLEDDHDTRDGWGSEFTDSTDQAKQFVREQAYEVYESFQSWSDPKPFGDKPYFAFDYGDLGFFVPDLRSFRDVSRPAAELPLLGSTQTRDLENWLQTSKKRKVLFFGLSIPIANAPFWVVDWLSHDENGLGDDFRDSWVSSYNRPELLDFLDKTFGWMKQSNGHVYTLGGDTHVPLLGRIQAPKDWGVPDIFEFTSSGVSNFDATAQTSWTTFQKFFWRNEVGNGIRVTVEKAARGLNYGVVEVGPGKSGYDVTYLVELQNPTNPNSVDTLRFYDSRGALAPFPPSSIERPKQ